MSHHKAQPSLKSNQKWSKSYDFPIILEFQIIFQWGLKFEWNFTDKLNVHVIKTIN